MMPCHRYEPFPVESSLDNALPDHFNAEIVAGTINTKQVWLSLGTLLHVLLVFI